MSDAAARIADLESHAGVGAAVRSAQLMMSMSEIAGTLSKFWNTAGTIISGAQQEAMLEALSQSLKWDAPLLKAGFTTKEIARFRSYIANPANFNVEAMLARVYKTRLPLSQQVYKTSALTQGWVERRINSAIARGEPVAQLAKEVKDFINPNTPGGQTYAARRLARTEINAAYHATTVAHNEDKPWNIGMQWALSKSHPKLDECDDMARRNHVGLGAGVYYTTDVPKKPHPQCFCYCYPVVEPIDSFLENLKAGDYRKWMQENYGAQ